MSKSLGPGKITFGATGTLYQFAAHATAAYLEPSYSDGEVVDFLDGSSDREADEESWVFGGTVRQGLEDASIEDWCLKNAGKVEPFVFEPINDGKKYTGTARIRAIKIGGDVKKKNTSDFAFPVIGAPELAP